MPILSQEPARRALGVSVPCQLQANRLPRPLLPANALPTLPAPPEVGPLAAHHVLPCQGPGPAERPPAGLLHPKASVHRHRAAGRGSASKPLPLCPPPISDLPLPVPRGRQIRGRTRRRNTQSWPPQSCPQPWTCPRRTPRPGFCVEGRPCGGRGLGQPPGQRRCPAPWLWTGCFLSEQGCSQQPCPLEL